MVHDSVQSPRSKSDIMNCPSRVDETIGHDGWNQNPSSLSADTTTCADFNGNINARDRQDEKVVDPDGRRDFTVSSSYDAENIGGLRECTQSGKGKAAFVHVNEKGPADVYVAQFSSAPNPARDSPKGFAGAAQKVSQVLRKFGTFIGPGQFFNPPQFKTSS
jgi:metal iron transporter